MGEFRMPSLGADMEEGILLEWLTKPGASVHRGDVVAVVETPKSAVEVETFEDGVVSDLLVDEGQTVPVGTVLATLAPVGEAAPAGGEEAAAAVQVAPPVVQAPPPPVVVPAPAGVPAPPHPVVRPRSTADARRHLPCGTAPASWAWTSAPCAARDRTAA